MEALTCGRLIFVFVPGGQGRLLCVLCFGCDNIDFDFGVLKLVRFGLLVL